MFLLKKTYTSEHFVQSYEILTLSEEIFMLRDKPLPTNEAERLIFMQNCVVKLPLYAAALGLTPLEVSTQADDTLNYEYLITVPQQVNDSKDAFYSFKELVIDGAITNVIPPDPTFPVIATPKSATPGIIKRIRLLVKRIKASTGFTDQIGEDLGLLENVPNSIVPQDIVPDMKLKALTGSRVEISFSKKGFDAMRVEYQRKNDNGWQLAGVFTSSPAIHELPPELPGEPESRSYRGVLMEKNVAVTQYSPTYTIVTTP
jgi:hypothetical protein